ncbi:uncharacterized protein A1O9_01278 [Exophiala aquamarina CBS 119918]|uniref:Uncharacterized protein n=1 Tax=Exophiala aquamarina CBS 119918 TaxID=1182545 RepID=A0A072PTY6_9EURO|nr:uncharacterized protein A1O9_01278 [Exophiala aquamarina CBS 119918]KEF63301.1 hypothetical protein A1O9_01278 [Exophiala aquamarina CBS 119918]
MDAHVAENLAWTNIWTPVNPPGKIASTSSSEPPHPCHDWNKIKIKSSRASCFRSTIIASAERMKWPAGPRKRKKSPTQSPTHRRKKVRVGDTEAPAPKKIAETSEFAASPLKPRLTTLANSGDVVALSSPILWPWNSNEQNANISKKRIDSKAFSCPKTRPSSLVVDGPDEQKKIQPIDEQLPHLPAQNENSDDLFLDNPEDVEDFLEAEKQLTATLSQPVNSPSPQPWQTSSGIARSPERPDLDLKLRTQRNSLPMKPFMREAFEPPPPSAKLTVAPTTVGFSPLKQSPTCFRIAEALRLLNHADPSHTITFELFAVLRPTSWTIRADETANHAIEISDLFFPRLPPILRLNIDSSQVHSLWKTHFPPTPQSLHSPQQNADEQIPYNIVRAIIKAWPQTTPLSQFAPRSMGETVREKFEIRVIHLRPSTWEEIKATRTLFEAPHSPVKNPRTIRANNHVASQMSETTAL